MEQRRPESGGSGTTFDEASMENSKAFVKALQELKNLRPQLYSAAEYCEKSYLHNEQKQMVLENLKSYAVRAIVNAVDHLGTVAYKLADLFEQQMVDITTVEMKITCLNQRISSCQAYGDKGLSLLRMSPRTTRHHKHYILPNSLSQRSSSQMSKEGNASPIQGKLYSHVPGNFISKTLSWHLASESNTSPMSPSCTIPCIAEARNSKVNSDVFHLLVAEELPASPFSSSRVGESSYMTSELVLDKFGLMDQSDTSKPTSPFKSIGSPSIGSPSIGSPGKRQIIRPPPRSKSLFFALFNKNKASKVRKISVS